MTTVTVRGLFVTPTGAAAQGRVSFTPRSNAVSNVTTNAIQRPVAVEATLDSTGAISVVLQATDDAAFLPASWSYAVVEEIYGTARRTYDISVPAASSVAGIDLADVAPVVADAGDVYAASDFFYDNGVTAGETTIPRHLAVASSSQTTQSMRLTYFTARKTESITTVGLTAGTAAGATPTIIRIGIYSLDASGNGTLVASTPNDTTLLATISTRYTKALSAPFTKVSGTRYAVGILVVTAFTVPTVIGWTSGAGYVMFAVAPRTTGLIAAQSDLPLSFTAGSVAASGSAGLVELIP